MKEKTFIQISAGENHSLAIDSLIYKCKMIMMLTGAKNISELKNLDYKVTGRLRELVDYDK